MLDIMIVDDSNIIIKTLEKNLTSMGFTVVATAKNGQEAIDLYDESEPDIITMDITMPEMDGIEALQKIREKNPQAKVVMITSHGEERLVMDAISAGAKGYILKPITPLKIKQTFQKVFPPLKNRIEDKYTELSLIY